MLRGIKSILPLRWKREALRLASPFRAPEDFIDQSPRLIVALAADYGNLGDVAITRAIIRFAAQRVPSHRPYLLCAGRVFWNLRGVACATGKDDLIAIVGGGNMGDRYPDLEEARCHVIRAFRRNRIVSFPQSFDFSDTASGRRALARSRDAYSSHPHLRLFARESESYDCMRNAFPGCQLDLAPDTVLSLEPECCAERTEPLLVCLRQDLESRLSAKSRKGIMEALQDCTHGLAAVDTHVSGPRLSFPQYETRLDALLTLFGKAKCVVTDRLHGLIFSVITRTPCVAIESGTHKIRSTWRTWLSDLPSVSLLADPQPADVLAAVHELSNMHAPGVSLNCAFAALAQALKS